MVQMGCWGILVQRRRPRRLPSLHWELLRVYSPVHQWDLILMLELLHNHNSQPRRL
jgi:hypothetical protein